MEESGEMAETSLSQQLRTLRCSTTWEHIAKDPRVPRELVSIRRNVSIEETCAFYGVKDAISGCRYPRSCRDCLTKPGCFIADNGACHEVGSLLASDDKDYRNATFMNDSAVSTSAHSHFKAGTATYCAVNDSVCSTCRAEFNERARSVDTFNELYTQFCLGQDGCVCIAACEVPEVFATRVYDRYCGQPRPIKKGVDMPKRQNFTSNYRDPRSTLVNVLNRRRAEESCAYYTEQDVRGCRRPRTCQDCLKRDGCVISNFMCAGMDKYDSTGDFRTITLDSNHRARIPSSTLFPSENTTYCPATDHICSDCRTRFSQKSYDSWESASIVSEICVGQDGCVCVELCESELWSSGVRDEKCDYDRGNRAGATVIVIALGVFVWLLLWMAYKCSTLRSVPSIRRIVEQEATRVWRHMLDEVPILMGLDLFGWRRYHEELLYKEQQVLQGEELVSPVYHPMDFDFVEPTAPDFDDGDSSAPTFHDPRALASAPLYCASLHDLTVEEDRDADFLAPSAPDFDVDESIPLRDVETQTGEGRSVMTQRLRGSA